MISRCFESHLNIYIVSQDKGLADLVDRFSSDMKSQGVPKPAADGSGVVITSAADFFVFYKKCLVQCASLSTGSPLLELTDLFKKYLKEYASRILSPNIPKIPTSTSSKLSLGALRRGDTSAEFNLGRDDLLTACSLLCTADYCLETTQQLETKLKEKIDKSLSNKVTFAQEEECFRNIISSCIQLLVQDMENACVSSFNAMVKVPWQNVEAVGDSSPYVSTVAAHIRFTIPLLRDTLTTARKYFINFCHKFANAVIPTFISYLYKCKPINTIAAEQLLLDTHSLKICLLDLPSAGAAVSRKPPSSYTTLVGKGMEKAELIVKVVMAPHQQAEEFISSYRKLMQGDTDVSNFQKVLEMKGLKRSEQHALTDLFKSKVASNNAESASLGEKGRMQPIKKLERLMRSAI